MTLATNSIGVAFAACAIFATSASAQSDLPPGWSVEEVVGGVDMPTGLGFTPDGRWMFIVGKQSPDVMAFDLVNNTKQTAPVITLNSYSDFGSETGTFSVVADPDYDNNHYIYVSRTPALFQFEVDRIHLVEGPSGITADSMIPIYGPVTASDGHIGGVIKFGPDGFLYVFRGDGEAVTSQDLSSDSGKILRMSRGGNPAGVAPFINIPGASPYLYATGLRNSFGIAFDPASGDFWEAEVGPSYPDFDEVNIIKPGRNYAWLFLDMANVTGPQDNAHLEDPVLWGTAIIDSPGMPTPVGIAFGHSWRYPADALGDVFNWWFGDHSLHRYRRTGANLEKIEFNEKFSGGSVPPGLALELAPDGYLYYTVFFSPDGAVFRIKYDESLLPPVQAAARGDLRPGGKLITYVSSMPQTPIVNYNFPYPDFAIAFVGEPLPPFDTPYGPFMIDFAAGAFMEFDRYGVARMDFDIPDDPWFSGITAYIQPFRIFGGDAYSTGVTSAPVPFYIQ